MIINCPMCSQEVLASAKASYFNNSENLYYQHRCPKSMYPNFWGYFNREARVPDELLIQLKHIEFYQENFEWVINLGHDDNVKTIASGETCLSLQNAYALLSRYNKLLAFT